MKNPYAEDFSHANLCLRPKVCGLRERHDKYKQETWAAKLLPGCFNPLPGIMTDVIVAGLRVSWKLETVLW